MTKTFRKAMISTIAMLVVGVMSLTGVTYAWFSMGTTASVDNISLSVDNASGGLQIGQIGSNNAIEWATSVTAPTRSDKLVPVSTDGVVASGVLNFLAGTVNGTTLENIASSNSYYMFNVYFRNDGNEAINVILDPTTSLQIAATSNTTGRSDYATRIAFVPSASSAIAASMTDADFAAGTSSIIYEPNATLHTAGAIIEKAASGWGTGEGNDAKWTYKALSTASTYTSTNRYSGSELVEMTTRETSSTATIVTVDAHSACRVKVYVWIEGQDADCINENAGATFTGAIKFKLPDAQ